MKIDKKRLLDALDRFSQVTVAVAGDLLADVYIYARPTGLSREAPVMVTVEESTHVTPGGAANAVNNVLELAGGARAVGILGDDAPGKALAEYFESHGAGGDSLIQLDGAFTCTKTRVFAGDLHTVKQQVFRLDRRPPNRMTKEVEKRILSAIDAAAAAADAWLVSDYDGDFFSRAVMKRLNELAREKVLVVDSHTRLGAYSGIACATPNETEASLASGIPIGDDETALRAAVSLKKRIGAQRLFLTRGNRGMVLVGPADEVVQLPIVGPSDIVDVAGAGDTVAAVTTLCLASGEDTLVAGLLASYAASVVCMKTGVATTSPDEIRRAIEEYPLPEI